MFLLSFYIRVGIKMCFMRCMVGSKGRIKCFMKYSRTPTCARSRWFIHFPNHPVGWQVGEKSFRSYKSCHISVHTRSSTHYRRHSCNCHTADRQTNEHTQIVESHSKRIKSQENSRQTEQTRDESIKGRRVRKALLAFLRTETLPSHSIWCFPLPTYAVFPRNAFQHKTQACTNKC